MESEEMLRIRQLTYSHGGGPILNNVSLEVAPGTIMALLGPSGSGKTTLLRIVAGLEIPAAGSVLLNDVQVSSPQACLPPGRRNTAMIFQSLALWPHMTVRRHLEYVLAPRRRGRPERGCHIDSLLQAVQLGHAAAKLPAALSGGEKQRLAIARALAADPELLLMDEPFSSLDDILRADLVRLTRSLCDHKHLTVLYVTHNIEEALELADTIAIIHQGKVARTWGPDQLPTLTRTEIVTALAPEERQP